MKINREFCDLCGDETSTDKLSVTFKPYVWASVETTWCFDIDMCYLCMQKVQNMFRETVLAVENSDRAQVNVEVRKPQ